MKLRILPRASTNGRGLQHIAVGVVLALLLIWFYRDYVEMEMILRILWFTFCMMLPHYYSDDIDITKMTFGEYYLSSIFVTFTPLNNYIYFFQIAFYFSIHFILRFIERDNIYDTYTKNFDSNPNNNDIGRLAHQSKKLILALIVFYGIHVCLRTYFFEVAVNTTRGANTPGGSLSSSSRAMNNCNDTITTNKVNSPSISKEEKHQYTARELLIYCIIMCFFIFNVLEAYCTNYYQTMELFESDNDQYGTRMSRWWYLSFHFISASESWRSIIVFFIYYKQVTISLIILLPLLIYGAKFLDVNITISGCGDWISIEKRLLCCVNGVFIYYLGCCGHRVVLLTLSLFIIMEIDKFEKYVKEKIVPLFEYGHDEWDKGIKRRRDEIESLEQKIRLIKPQLRTMITYIMIHTFVYFGVDLWIAQCTGYYDATDHDDDVGKGLHDVLGMSSLLLSLSWESVINWLWFIFVENIQQTRHLFFIGLNFYVLFKIHRFNTYWRRKVANVFINNKVKLWNEISLRSRDNYNINVDDINIAGKFDCGNMIEKNKRDARERYWQLMSFDKEYDIWNEYFKNNLNNAASFTIFGIKPGAMVVLVNTFALLQKTKLIPLAFFTDIVDSIMHKISTEDASIQSVFCLGFDK